MVSTVMKQPALVKSWQFPIDYEVPCTFTCIVLGDKSVVKARISGTSAAHIYFDGFIFNFPNQAINATLDADKKKRKCQVPTSDFSRRYRPTYRARKQLKNRHTRKQEKQND
ncbi:unnamed protein product [Brassica rapa]|uniref:Uncharacterized protein n=2 Tax=Brassica TaxID=3705 RepID=A0A8D9HQ36_BRACM|nr:unnamed protein product [Brassica napus]CAG7903783.1 unnamed protein product [Brassica rapa]